MSLNRHVRGVRKGMVGGTVLASPVQINNQGRAAPVEMSFADFMAQLISMGLATPGTSLAVARGGTVGGGGAVKELIHNNFGGV